jgi:nucleotide-binding universal stress UspA family protein
MKNNNYKILVLADLNESTSTTLNSAIKLTKIVDGDINFFSVKKPLDIVEKDNQLSAMRTINEKHNLINKKIKKLVTEAYSKHGVTVSYNFTFGNIKNEIEDYINSYKPDVIVLGKRKPTALGLIRDNITSFVLKKYSGIIMIADEKSELNAGKDLEIGFLNDSMSSSNKHFTESITRATQNPLKAFKIANTLSSETSLSNKNTVEYVFEKGDNAIKNIGKYLLKSKINLLCVNRNETNERATSLNIKEVINNATCSLILTN